MVDKQAIRPIYSELQGYLAQAPKEGATYEMRVWEDYNKTIEELNSLTGKNYNKFSLTPTPSSHPQGSPHLNYDVYRGKLGGIIARLHGEYFSDEPAPFASMPSTIITQSQNQTQSLHVQLLLEVNDLINEKLNKVGEGTKEKKFLEKIKGSLSAVKNVSQLISLIMTTAKAVGIPIDQLASLFV